VQGRELEGGSPEGARGRGGRLGRRKIGGGGRKLEGGRAGGRKELEGGRPREAGVGAGA
jgi:hypothetical protein